MLKWFVRHWKISLSLFAICVGVFVFFLAMIGSAFVVLTGSSDSGGGASTTTGGLKITASELAKKANIPEKKAEHVIDIANKLLVSEGFTIQGTSGALAVAERETQVDPPAVNDSGGVAGVFQWSGWSNTINGNRWAMADEKTLSMPIEMGLMSKELNSTHAKTKAVVGVSSDPESAALDWSVYYEGVALSDGQTNATKLKENAKKWYDLLKDELSSTNGGQIEQLNDIIGKSIGSGQCYAISSLYAERLNFGPLIGGISASAIGQDYNWSAKGWEVITEPKATDVRAGDIVNWKNGALFSADQSIKVDSANGHTGVVASVSGNLITVYSQNPGPAQLVTITGNDTMFSSTIHPPKNLS